MANCECNNNAAMFNLKGPQFGIDRDELKKLIEEITGGSGSGGTGSGDQIIPDLRISKETKMPLRMYGKQVYGTMVDFGALPNGGTKNLAHGLTDVDWISVDDDLSRVTNPQGTHYSPNYPSASATSSWCVFIDKTNVSMATGVNRTSFKAVICVLYTKESESAVA